MIVKSIEEKKKKKKKATVGDKTTFVEKKALSGAISGTTNIVKSPLQNVRKEITKGETKQNSSLSNKTKDAVKALVYTLNPTLGNIANSIETGKKNRETLKDKDKNALEKTVQILGRSFTSESNRNKVGLNKTFETLGELGTGDKLSKSVKNAEDFISKPSKKIQERLAKEGQNYDKTTQAVGNVFETVGNMAPSIVASGVTKNPTLSTTLMSTSAKASATEEAENKGKNIEEAVNIGNLKGTAEALTEKISGGAKIFGKGSIDDITENAINKYIKNKGLNFAAKQGLGIAGEVSEEELSNVLSNIVDKGYGEKDKKIFNKQEAKDTALQTIGSTALLNLLTGGYGGNAYNNNVKQLNQYNKGQEIQKQVKSGKLTPEQGMQALEQIKNGTYEQNNVVKQIAQEQVKIIQEQVKNGQITPDEASKQINAITQTVEQQINNINSKESNTINLSEQLIKEIDNKTKNNMKDKNVSYEQINDIINLTNNGGHRNTQQISNLENSIRQNGIENPIEIEVDENGNKSIYNGNHRLEIAKKLGLKEIPVKYSNPIESNVNLSYNNPINDGGYNDEINKIRTENDKKNGRIESIKKNDSVNNRSFTEERTTTRNVGLSEPLGGYNNRSSNNTTFGENVKKNETRIIDKEGTSDSSFSNDNIAESKYNAEEILRINNDGTTELNKERPKFLDEIPKENNKKTIREKRKELASDLSIKFVNRNAELDRISKETKNNMLKTETDRLGIARAEAQSNIGRGQTNINGKKYINFIDKNCKTVNMSLEGIWNDANEQGITDATLRDYLIAKLNIDRHNQGIDQFNIPTYESQETINKIEKEHKDIKRVANNVWQYQKNQLQNKVDAGLISKDSQQFFEENTPHYIRIQRNVSKNGSNVMSSFNSNITMKDTIQNIKGGVDDILPLRQTMAQYEIDSTNAIRKNIVLQELAKSLNYGEQSDMISLDGELNINPELIVKNNDGTYTATFFKDGNAVKIPINEGIYESLNGKTKMDLETTTAGKVWNKVVGGMSSIQRALLTDKNPIFMITNFFKDIGDAPLNSKYGTTRFASTYARLFGSRTIGKLGNENTSLKNAVELYGSLGGFDNTYFTNGDFVENNKSKIGKITDKILSPIEKGNEFIESMPRITEFISTIEANGYKVSESGDLITRKGSKPTKTQQEVLSEALYNAAEITTNFKRGGTWSKALNRNGATFLNASIQGFDKQIRNIKGMKNPKTALNLLTKVAMLGVAPALLNDAMYEDDEEYEDLQDYVKDQYYLFKGEDGEWIRIPKGRVMSVISGTTRRTKELSKGNKDAFKGFVKEASGQVAPNNPFEDNIFAPIKAIKDNKAWSGNKIVSDSIANSEHPEEEYDAKTSEIAKTIGKAFNYSPKKIDYILDQYSGGIGDVILPMTTNYAESDSDSKFGALINPLKSKFTTDSVNNNKNVSKFYEELEKAEGNKKYSKATNEDKAKYSYLYSTSLGLAELYKQQREIENNTSLSDSEKYNQAREIQKEIISQMKDAMDKVENAQSNNGAIKIGDSFYTTKNDGSFGKINNESVTKANELDIDPVIYSKATNDIYNIHDIKDSNGKTIKTRKQQVYEYINKLNLTAKQKQNLYNKYYKR